MSRSFYELQYGATDPDSLGGLRWHTATDGNGHPRRWENITEARAAMEVERAGGSRCRLCRVEEIRTPCI